MLLSRWDRGERGDFRYKIFDFGLGARDEKDLMNRMGLTDFMDVRSFGVIGGAAALWTWPQSDGRTR